MAAIRASFSTCFPIFALPFVSKLCKEAPSFLDGKGVHVFNAFVDIFLHTGHEFLLFCHLLFFFLHLFVSSLCNFVVACLGLLSSMLAVGTHLSDGHCHCTSHNLPSNQPHSITWACHPIKQLVSLGLGFVHTTTTSTTTTTTISCTTNCSMFQS